MKIEDLSRRAMSLVQQYAGKNDVVTIARLAPIPEKLERLAAQRIEIDREVARIAELLESFDHPSKHPLEPEELLTANSHGKSDRTRLWIELNWSRCIRNGQKELICEHKASDSLVRFVTSIYNKLGIEALNRLSRLAVSRGPFVTRRPEIDYRNNSSGGLFQHQPVSDSGFWVLTHSQTSQKVNDIDVAWYRSLCHPEGSLKVKAIGKYEVA